MIKLQIKLTKYQAELIEEVCQLSGRSKTAEVEQLLYLIELLARNGQLTKESGFTLDFIEAASVVNARGHGAKHLDPVQLAGGEDVAFDVTLLEKTAKSKSGFAGVYATTGSSFRALVPDFNGGGSRYLPSRPTALQAAIDRYRYFEEHGLPYGNVGWHVDKWRSKNVHLDVDGALQIVLSEADTMGLKNPYTRAQVEAVIERRRQLGIYTPPSSPPSLEANDTHVMPEGAPVTVTCALCESDIEDGEPFAAYHDGTWVHVYCRDGAIKEKSAPKS